MRIALLCGGPWLERGISLNSARTVLDHLDSEDFEVIPFYLDCKKKPYKISKAQLYSNNPSDFDFKLRETTSPLTEKKFAEALKKTDIVFPVIHGQFGEDGGIQKFLEKYDIPFIGSPASVCRRVFDKFNANELLRNLDFFALPSAVLRIYRRDHRQILQKFFKTYGIARAIVKPATGGSSIGVFSVGTVDEALTKVDFVFSRRMDTRVVVEPFAEGREFTVIILENRYNLPVAILPMEIETDYASHQIFDFRKKYLPTGDVRHHCPPRFPNEVIEKILVQAEQVFRAFGMRDFARFDGWVLRSGEIWFSDFNPISGMEQNSLLFQQTSRIGLSHKDTIRYILERTCGRYGIAFPRSRPVQKNASRKGGSEVKVLLPPKPVNILFGGNTSERQVSLMSGTNVWLKLRDSVKYKPEPFLLDLKGDVWSIPYPFALKHSVEEVVQGCGQARRERQRVDSLRKKVLLRLGFSDVYGREEFFEPKRMTLTDFIKKSSFVFIALHGGFGEDGTLQKLLMKRGVKFNGSGEAVSRLCMDKWDTATFVKSINVKGIQPIPGAVYKVKDFDGFGDKDFFNFWKRTRRELGAETIVVKPRADGCSSGVVHLYSAEDLKKYFSFLKKRVLRIPSHSFKNQRDAVEMPFEVIQELILEKFIETDLVRVKGNRLKYYKKTGWIEVTIGVIEERGRLKVFSPSITIAEGEVLTVEEKFQGGTGINITPPPKNIVGEKALQRVKKLIGELAVRAGIRGYGRIDAFLHVATGDVMAIEVNTLPALTPSTVFYHQALAENPPIFPRQLLERIIENSDY